MRDLLGIDSQSERTLEVIPSALFPVRFRTGTELGVDRARVRPQPARRWPQGHCPFNILDRQLTVGSTVRSERVAAAEVGQGPVVVRRWAIGVQLQCPGEMIDGRGKGLPLIGVVAAVIPDGCGLVSELVDGSGVVDLRFDAQVRAVASVTEPSGGTAPAGSWCALARDR